VNIPKLKRLLADIDHTLSIECFNNVAAQWNFETNVNEVTQVEAVSKKPQNQKRNILEKLFIADQRTTKIFAGPTKNMGTAKIN
jgi:hypothetical protein